MTSNRRPPLAAEVYPVREVSVLGEVDVAPLAARLQATEVPLPAGARVQVLASATDTKFRGIWFQEFSLCVLLDDQHRRGSSGPPDEPTAVMLQAFNSIRFFAWVERTLFSTPYDHARIEVRETRPAVVNVTRRGVPLVCFRMDEATARQDAKFRDETWDGRVLLPSRKPGRPGKMFFATLSGPEDVLPATAADAFRFHPHADYPLLAELAEANFQAIQWQLRSAGRHGKSKTVARDWK